MIVHVCISHIKKSISISLAVNDGVFARRVFLFFKLAARQLDAATKGNVNATRGGAHADVCACAIQDRRAQSCGNRHVCAGRGTSAHMRNLKSTFQNRPRCRGRRAVSRRAPGRRPEM